MNCLRFPGLPLIRESYRLSALFSLLAVFMVPAHGGITPTPAGPETLRFLDRQFELVRAVGDAQGVWKQYVPAGQTLENWTESVSLHLFYGNRGPRELMEQHRDMVEENFPGAEFGEQVTRDGREARLRYIVRTDDPVPVGKFTIWRFMAMERPRVQVLAYEYSLRTFNPDRTEFNREINDNMSSWTQALLQARYSAPEIRVNRRQVDGLGRRGAALIQGGQVPEGLRLLVQATEEDPQNPDRFLNLGKVLFSLARSRFSAETEQEALTLFSRARDILEEAAELYAIFSPRDPGHAEALYLLGEIAFHIHDNLELARIRYEKALDINPQHNEARSAMRVFR